MQNTSIIEIKEISKSYGSKKVLDNLSLNIPTGSVFGLLGKNGEGKTTLIKSILGLLKIPSGNISVLEDNPWSFKETTKERIGYVPQSDRVYPWLSVDKLIEYTASFYRTWNSNLIDSLVKDWDIDLKAKYGLLSEGEAQKVSIMLSLGHEPELLVLDEPVASLDPLARRQFLKTILDVVQDRVCSVFFSTHITSDLERVADRVAVLKNGKIDFNGELDQLKDEVKRLRLVTDKDLERIHEYDEVIHFDKEDNSAVVSVRGFNEEFKKRLESDFEVELDVEALNLEEIFLELNR